MPLTVDEHPPAPVASLAYDLGTIPAGEHRSGSQAPTLADLTTLRVGGRVADYVEAASEAEIIDIIRTADAESRPLLMLGGGSNIVASDAPFDGVVLRDTRTDITQTADDRCGGAEFTVTAGTSLDTLVTQAIAHHWGGFAPLSGIPGTVGAAPVQNVGAYGAEMSELLASVRAWDRELNRPVHLPLSSLGFGYRTSVLKQSMIASHWGPTPRWVVLSVTFSVRQASLSAPIAYPGLAQALGVDIGERVDARAVRDAVLDLRRSKGMVLDAADHNTWSAGSYFTNPILTAQQAASLPSDAPRWPVNTPGASGLSQASNAQDQHIKTSAAWLIEHAGMPRGFTTNERAALSGAHVLAITNRGQASASDIRELAGTVTQRVKDAYGVTLVPEPVYL